MLPDTLPQGLEGGRMRDIMHLTEEDFDLWEIAGRLAKINRFCGATKWPLSVALHSVAVSYMVPEHLARTALLHDITESFAIGDMISPVKRLLPEYRALEEHIHNQLCVPFPDLRHVSEVDWYDKRATAIEAQVHRGRWPEWAEERYSGEVSEKEKRIRHTYYSMPWQWYDAKREFQLRAEELELLP